MNAVTSWPEEVAHLNLSRHRAFIMLFPHNLDLAIPPQLPGRLHSSRLLQCLCTKNRENIFLLYILWESQVLDLGAALGKGYMLEWMPRFFLPISNAGVILGTRFVLEMEAGHPELHLKMHKDVSMWGKQRMFSSWP